MDRPLISVIIPVYNVEKYLDRCIESVITQTYNNIEIILIDDGSLDKSGVMCDNYCCSDERVRVFHKENGGLSDARNFGVAVSRGKYISFVDSDDTIDSDMIEYLYELLAKYKVKMSICTHRVLYSSGNIMITYGDRGDVMLTSKQCIKRILYHDVIDTSAWAKLYSRDLLNDNFFPRGKIFEDIGSVYKAFVLSKYIACGFKAKYNYWLRKDSIVRSSFNIKKLDLLEMTDMMAKDVVSMYPDLQQAALRRQVYARFSTLNQMLFVEGYDDIRDEIINYIKRNAVKLLADVNTPLRDKFGCLILLMSKRAYMFVWEFLRYKGE